MTANRIRLVRCHRRARGVLGFVGQGHGSGLPRRAGDVAPNKSINFGGADHEPAAIHDPDAGYRLHRSGCDDRPLDGRSRRAVVVENRERQPKVCAARRNATPRRAHVEPEIRAARSFPRNECGHIGLTAEGAWWSWCGVTESVGRVFGLADFEATPGPDAGQLDRCIAARSEPKHYQAFRSLCGPAGPGAERSLAETVLDVKGHGGDAGDRRDDCGHGSGDVGPVGRFDLHSATVIARRAARCNAAIFQGGLEP